MERLLQRLTLRTKCRVSFDDLSGVTFDVPELRLSESSRHHVCDFCLLAKGTQTGLIDCLRSKKAANRIALRRRRSFSGACHLGLTDIVQPLIYKGRALGVFYGGSVLVRGTEREAERRTRAYCHDRRIDPSAHLSGLRGVKRITRKDLAGLHADLSLVAEVIAQILDASSLALDRYRTEPDRLTMHLHRNAPPLIEAAIRHINRHYQRPLQLKDIAGYLHCSEAHLCRAFRRNMSCGVGDYLLRVRIDHARRLLHSGRLGIGEVGFQVGFQSDSHFVRTFKRLTGTTPGAFRENLQVEKPPLDFKGKLYSRVT